MARVNQYLEFDKISGGSLRSLVLYNDPFSIQEGDGLYLVGDALLAIGYDFSKDFKGSYSGLRNIEELGRLAEDIIVNVDIYATPNSLDFPEMRRSKAIETSYIKSLIDFARLGGVSFLNRVNIWTNMSQIVDNEILNFEDNRTNLGAILINEYLKRDNNPEALHKYLEENYPQAPAKVTPLFAPSLPATRL